MHSFLIVSKNRQGALDYAMGECIKIKINKFDISVLSFEKSVGIEDVRNFQKKIILKPLKSKTKAVILESFSGITIEAQNALLKLLEEPPANTIIYITSANKELLLPTILSRCKIIELKQEIQSLSKQELLSTEDILVYLQSKEIGGKLKLAQDLAKNKDEALPWLEKMIIVAREELIDSICHSGGRRPIESPDGDRIATPHDDTSKISQYLKILISLQRTFTILKTTNVNPRIILENLFLSI